MLRGARRPSPDRGRPADLAPPRASAWSLLANGLTLLRVALVPVIGWLLVSGGRAARWWAFAIFGFAALTDSVDGWVARRLQGVTRWGQLADPLADKALIIGSLGVLAWRHELPWLAVAIIALREAAVSLQRVALVRRGLVMPASVYGKAKTLSQVLAVTLYLLPATPQVLRDVALWTAVVVTVASGLEYARRGRSLQRG
ncbi:MAG TPA: CDP-diacylglycerol--glycerol-3-phosphate 3-phosphatidyltransferase [Egibacteraceae bacterium]|nr:CDP-diacylglycerol--glycerol-3-phosphate 3-phosphatidyltransferase [Actinomycetota bacterium]HWB72658.1 CDP-diacylglycerol--glycerol-3-phosphate 3-phosphatidyltransferase [Egibacteraceae bacterium]